jgi:two-component system, OmpR family, phosphate regulon response regulator PhoB
MTSTPLRRTPPDPAPGGRRLLQHTILLVEDDPAVREVLRRAFAAAGYAVIDTDDPDRACEGVQEASVHGLVLDVRLSRSRTGLEVLRFIRTRPRDRDAVAVILTGVTLSADEESVIRRDRAYVFYKPVGTRELVEFFDEHLRSA